MSGFLPRPGCRPLLGYMSADNGGNVLVVSRADACAVTPVVPPASGFRVTIGVGNGADKNAGFAEHVFDRVDQSLVWQYAEGCVGVDKDLFATRKNQAEFNRHRSGVHVEYVLDRLQGVAICCRG
jgi:hypothetical protein